MKNIKACTIIRPLIILFVLIMASCDSSEDGSSLPNYSSGQTSKIQIRLTDAPGDYDQVNIEIIDIMIKASSDQNDDSGWVSIYSGNEPIMLDLLSLTGGVDRLLADSIVPSGKLGQIRLVLGNRNSIVIDKVESPLQTPSALQSGLKVLVNQDMQVGHEYDFVLDFDVDKSIVKSGNPETYSLRPVLRVFDEDNSGEIDGRVLSNGFQVKASVTLSDNTEVSAYANSLGEFELNGVPAGTYTLVLTPDPTSPYMVTTKDNVTVTNDHDTELGTLLLNPK